MPVGFGFSVGDFISGICLLRKAISAFNDANGSIATLDQLDAELESLQCALGAISEWFEDDMFSSKERKAIDLAIKACQKCIDDFCQSISHYQKHLKRDGNSVWRSSYLKIKWAVCKPDDVVKFKSMLSICAHPILFHLSTHQSKAVQALTKTVQDHDELTRPGVEYEQVQEMNYMLKDIVLRQEGSLEAEEQHRKVSLSKFNALEASFQFREHEIPAQVLLSQPVILLDACGKIAPFHLEFINSLQAFVAVKLVHFEEAGISQLGLERVRNLEFTLRDTKHKRPIDLSRPWCSTLRPGQVIDMNMMYPTITYRLARLSVKKRKLLCYNFWFPCLTQTPSEDVTSVSALIGPQPMFIPASTQQYDRLEEFKRVHLILECEKSRDISLSVPIEASALTNFMENVGHAFSIYWQHLVVTVDSAVTIGSDFEQVASDCAVRTMGRSPRRDFSDQKRMLRSGFPEGWDRTDM